MNKNCFAWSDSWLLASLFFIGPKEIKDLSSIIACGDWLNHAIFNYEEIDIGLAHLQEAGLISFSNGVIVLAEKSLVEKTRLFNNKKRIGAQKVFEQVDKFLGVTYQDKLIVECNYKPGKFIKRYEYEEAIKKYLGKR